MSSCLAPFQGGGVAVPVKAAAVAAEDHSSAATSGADGDAAAALLSGFVALQQPRNEAVKRHYDQITRSENEGQLRVERSEIRALRAFHNEVKRTLIRVAIGNLYTHSPHRANGSLWVADLAAGRGGDVHKWLGHYFKIERLHLVDFASEACEEAARRLRDALAQRPARRNFSHHVLQVDLSAGIGGNDWAPRAAHTAANLGNFDMVTCFFAVHYLARDERRPAQSCLTHFMRNAAALLRPHNEQAGETYNAAGRLLLIYPDAERVRAFRNNSICQVQHWRRATNTERCTMREWHSYRFNLQGCVDHCEEWFVEEKDLERAAQVCRLRRTSRQPLLEVTRRAQHALSDAERSVSELYVAAEYVLDLNMQFP